MSSQGPRDERESGKRGVILSNPDWTGGCGEPMRGEDRCQKPYSGKMETAVGEAGGDMGKSWSQREEDPAHTGPCFSRLRDWRG